MSYMVGTKQTKKQGTMSLLIYRRKTKTDCIHKVKRALTGNRAEINFIAAMGGVQILLSHTQSNI